MELFQIDEKKKVSPSVHVLMLEPFKSIWEDDDDSKERALKIFTYVEFTNSPLKSNPFAGYTTKERPAKVKKLVFGEESPQIDEETISDIIVCSHKYQELLAISSPAYALYESAANAVGKLRDFLDTFDFDERTKSGGMVLKPQDITTALGKLDEVERNMTKARDKVHEELIDASKTRNQRKIGHYER